MSAEAEFGETDYGTNSQTEGVDEGDLVKSDGTYVYAAYGDRLVVFSKDGGGKLSETFMPKSPPPEGCGGGYQYDDDPFPMPMPMPMPEPDVGGNRRRRRNLQRRDHDRRRTSIVPPYWDPCHIADPRIESILLDDESGRVSVIVAGNQRPSHYYWGYGPSREDDDEQTILGDSAGTQGEFHFSCLLCANVFVCVSSFSFRLNFLSLILHTRWSILNSNSPSL